MRFSDDMRFPHPVLAPFEGDYTAGKFDVDFRVREDTRNGALTLSHEVILTEPGIKELVRNGQASIGCFIRCNDTYFAELRTLSWPSGEIEFAPGALLNRVSLRPLIWLRADLPGWDPGTIHEEFDPPVDLGVGDVMAIAEEYVISVGQQKLAPIESIFELDRSPDTPEGELEVDLDRDRIAIRAGPDTYERIALLREQAKGRSMLMSGVFLPAVMEVLDSLRVAPGEYEERRWHQPFIAKCDAKGVDAAATANSSIFNDAQKLLEHPVKRLVELTDWDE